MRLNIVPNSSERVKENVASDNLFKQYHVYHWKLAYTRDCLCCTMSTGTISMAWALSFGRHDYLYTDDTEYLLHVHLNCKSKLCMQLLILLFNPLLPGFPEEVTAY